MEGNSAALASQHAPEMGRQPEQVGAYGNADDIEAAKTVEGRRLGMRRCHDGDGVHAPGEAGGEFVRVGLDAALGRGIVLRDEDEAHGESARC